MKLELNAIKGKILKLRKDLSMYSGHGNVVNHVKDQIASGHRIEYWLSAEQLRPAEQILNIVTAS